MSDVDDDPSELELLRAALGVKDLHHRVIDAHSSAAAAIATERRACVELLEVVLDTIRADLPIVMRGELLEVVPERLHLQRSDGQFWSETTRELVSVAEALGPGNAPRNLALILKRIHALFTVHDQGGHESRTERSTRTAVLLNSITALARMATKS